MPVNLEIPDGDPWWLSPNVWTVPGNDPEGSEGMPIAGEPCYMWARVTNNGTSNVDNATVRFYWANPSVGFNRMTANQIGSSYISLNAGETADVLCLIPWMPDYINEGHLCILAEAFHPSLDPLPATTEFNVQTDRHVAQRNITVVQAKRGMFKMSFEIHNPGRKEKKFQIKARIDKIKKIEPIKKHFNSRFKIPKSEGEIGKLGFITQPCPDLDSIKSSKKEINDVKIKPGQKKGLTLVGTIKKGVSLIHIEQRFEKRIVGGLSVLVFADDYKKDKRSRR